ncbi:MAG: YjbQ family protein [Candidatus Daviesbacteria bacterium]|nr:MAG: YjbQ family protein [Candidatus Daviesbacteria bacterium]
MMVFTNVLTIKSKNPAVKMMDITKKVEREVVKSKVTDGQVLVFARHTTAAVILQENEPGIGQDLHNILCGIAPQEGDWHHDRSSDHLKDKMPNGHSHAQHVFLGSSEIIPLCQGKMLLGTYQKIFLVELDRTRMRDIVVQVTGE